MEPAQPRHTGIGLYLAFLQLFFTLTWTVYVIFLPKLAAQVGIRPQAVIVILMLDQAIFAAMDWLMGRMADRWARVIGRLSRIVAVTTAVSCVAFLLLPFAAPTGSEALFLGLTILWSASSSVLRAPPLALGQSNGGDGKSGNEGSITGALFSLLAIATFARMMIVWTELNKDPTFAAVQPWLPVAAWMLAAGLLLAIALRLGEGGVSQRV